MFLRAQGAWFEGENRLPNGLLVWLGIRLPAHGRYAGTRRPAITLLVFRCDLKPIVQPDDAHEGHRVRENGKVHALLIDFPVSALLSLKLSTGLIRADRAA